MRTNSSSVHLECGKFCIEEEGEEGYARDLANQADPVYF
jgi:hypothetical protein